MTEETPQMPPDKLKFFQDNKTIIKSLIDKENFRRDGESTSLLTEPDIDTAVDKMMLMVSRGGELKKFRFAGASATSQQATAPSVKKASGDSFVFETVVCNNGFLLNMTTDGKEQSFIFRTEKDLMAIFKNTVFAQFNKLKSTKESINDPV